MYYHYFYPTSLGLLKIKAEKDTITGISYAREKIEDALSVKKETPLIANAFLQLTEYLDGKRTVFNLPISPKGTSFQQKVWQTLMQIPYGETWSYKQLAAYIGNPNASRAVGLANNKNPIAIIIPCHRVIGANGSLTGYAGGIDKKEMLLSLELNGELK